MGFILHEVTSSEEMSAIIDCQREAFKFPFNPFLVMFTPQGLDPTATRTAMIKNQWDTHINELASHWLKVVDLETGNIVGAAQWHVHETDPFSGPDEHRINAVWWPEGAWNGH